MKFTLPHPLSINIYTVLRRAGYIPIHDRRSGKDSYARQITGNRYPRFHLYLNEAAGQITFDLHLDQNKNLYEGQTAHNADYDSDQVKEELTRLYQLISQAQSTEASSSSPTKSPLDVLDEKPASKKGWLGRLFGQ